MSVEFSPFAPAKITEQQLERLRSLLLETTCYEAATRVHRLREAATMFAASDSPESDIESLRLAVACSILADLMQQGCEINVDEKGISTRPVPFHPGEGETVQGVKERIRQGLEAASNIQLAEDSVRAFLCRVERRRSRAGKVGSIIDLVDDGRELTTALEGLRTLPTSECEEKLAEIVDPYIQECVPGAECEFTGLKLLDVWRYFRHTWSLEYNPLPGRTQRFLIRNRARTAHPVIGIAMIASPTANLGSRDEWIGWTYDKLVERLVADEIEPKGISTALVAAIDTAIADIRSDDLMPDEELDKPGPHTLFRLEQIKAKATARRSADLSASEGSRLVDIRSVDKSKIRDAQWKALSETSLYTKKRSEQLIPLLEAKIIFNRYGFASEPVVALYTALTKRDGQTAVKTALNEIKKRRLAAEVADLAVCGAITPYNELLGGKLVTLLMASEDVRQMYATRYSKQPSEIASQIAGRAIVREPELRVITTTSLYGIGSSQYNRLNLKRADYPALMSDLRWERLRDGLGVSTTHVSDETVRLMRELGTRYYGRRRINSVFGEGSSPRMRQIKEGLNLIGVNDRHLLQQSRGRQVYGCELYPGAKDELLGLEAQGPGKASASTANAIAASWRDRWLTKRIMRDDVLERVARARRTDISERLWARGNTVLMIDQPDLEGLDGARPCSWLEESEKSESTDSTSANTAQTSESPLANRRRSSPATR